MIGRSYTTNRVRCQRLLRDVVRACSSGSGNPEVTLREALSLVCGVGGWSVGHLMAYRRSATLRSTDIWYISPDYTSDAFSGFRRATTQRDHANATSLPGRAATTRVPQWITDCRGTITWPRQSEALAAGLCSAIAFPLFNWHEVAGVAECYGMQPWTVNPDLLETLLQAASHVGRILGLAFDPTSRSHESRDPAFIEADNTGTIVDWNKAAEELFGWTGDEARGHLKIERLVARRYRVAYQAELARQLMASPAGISSRSDVITAITRDGVEFQVEFKYWPLNGRGPMHFFAVVRRRERQRGAPLLYNRDEAEYHDALTGLPDRRLLIDRLQQMLAQRELTGDGVALLSVGIVHFADIALALDDRAKAEVVATAAERLRRVVRPTDTVAKISEDSFLVACPYVSSNRDASLIARRIVEKFTDPVETPHERALVAVSIGIAMGWDRVTAPRLVEAANTARRLAAASGRGIVATFDHQMQQAAALRLRTEEEFRGAVAGGQMRLYVQPVVAAVNGSVVGMEGLVRWQHPTRGLLLPDQFIGIAEETGAILELGQWLAAQACRFARRWTDAAPADTVRFVSLNLSGCEVTDRGLLGVIRSALQAEPLDPRRMRLALEIIETARTFDQAGALKVLRKLRLLGVHIFVDDYGTKYSSLGRLVRLPVDVVKLDRSLVVASVRNRRSQAVIRAFTTMCHELDIRVIAEGVETEAQDRVVKDAGVDYIQGFRYWKPMPADAALEAVRSDRHPVERCGH